MTKENLITILKSLKPLDYVALSVVISFFLFNNLYHGGYAVDDAYISFRYLDNLIDGHGLVFNPGEKVEGYTNFLWIILLLPLHTIGLSVETAALILNIVFTLITMFAVFNSARLLCNNQRQAGWIAVILLAGYGSFSFWITGGMEPICVAALIAWANYYLIRDNALSPTSALLFGAAALVRPDSVIFAAIAFLFFLPLKSFNKAAGVHYLKMSALFVALPLTHLVFRWFYYGDILPNTFYAKMHPDAALIWQFGFAYFKRFLWAGGFIFIVIILLGIILKSYSPHRRIVGLIAVQSIVFTLYIMNVGGDYMLYFRFMIPIVPGLVLLSAISLWTLAQRFKQHIMPVALATLCATALSINLLYSSDMEQAPGVRQASHDNEVFSVWLTQNFPPQTVLAMNLVGLVPYRTGMPVIDMLGLNDKHIAKGKIATPRVETGSYIGHFKYDGDYVCAKRPDILVPTTLGLHHAPNPSQALWQTLLQSYDSDREFLRNPQCMQLYKQVVKELLPRRYVVIYVKK